MTDSNELYPSVDRSNPYTDACLATWEQMVANGQTQYVHVNMEMLDAAAENLAEHDFILPDWKNPDMYPALPDTFARFILLANTINSAFIHSGGISYQLDELNTAGKPYAGSSAMFRRLYTYFIKRRIPINADTIEEAMGTREKFEDFFRGANNIPFVRYKFDCLQDFIRGLREHFDSDPINIIKRAAVEVDGNRQLRAFNSGTGLVDILGKYFPVAYGADYYEYEGKQIYVLKKAQLTALMMYERGVVSKDFPTISDVECIGPIADYRVPDILSHMGILNFSGALWQALSSHWTLAQGEGREVEMRLAQIYAVHELLQRINEYRQQKGKSRVHIGHLDFYLWQAGRRLGNDSTPIVSTGSY